MPGQNFRTLEFNNSGVALIWFYDPRIKWNKKLIEVFASLFIIRPER